MIYNDYFALPLNLFGSRWDFEGVEVGGRERRRERREGRREDEREACTMRRRGVRVPLTCPPPPSLPPSLPPSSRKAARL
jgi:hypothetical protein